MNLEKFYQKLEMSQRLRNYLVNQTARQFYLQVRGMSIHVVMKIFLQMIKQKQYLVKH
jgi:hypothetical protein